MQAFQPKDYLKTLKERSQNTRVSKEFQLIGLEIATLLHDLEHKALYIKLAKQYGSDRVLALAKSVAERRDVKNMGAYFMSLTKNLK